MRPGHPSRLAGCRFGRDPECFSRDMLLREMVLDREYGCRKRSHGFLIKNSSAGYVRTYGFGGCENAGACYAKTPFYGYPFLFTTMFVTKEFTFHASHFLTKYYGKCERLHGHSYRLAVTVEGEIGENDMVIDFGVLKRIVVRRVIDRLDHHHLNELFENPSAERVCEWIWEQLEPFEELLRDEVSDPNITDGMRKFLMEGESVDAAVVTRETSFGVRLYEVRLWETEGSSVIKRAS